MPGALSHIRVLDLSRVLAGPWCTQILADLGAEVIKVERPGAGDDTRGWGPPYAPLPDGSDSTESAYYLCTNRGKKSLTLDISKPEGQAIVLELARTADVFIENYKVGGLQRYGLDYAALRAVKPDIVYCSITGFGQDGPYAERAGYDFMIQGMGGLMSVTGERDDLPGGGPQKVGVAVADLFTGMYACTAILAALNYRERTGIGQYIDMALLDTQITMLANINMNYLCTGKLPQRWGNAHANVVPYQAFATADGHVILAIGNDSQFAKFCAVAAAPELAEDERFRRNSERVRNRDVLVPVVAELMRRQSCAFWLEALGKSGVPCGAINDVADVFADPHVRHRGLLRELEHPSTGRVPAVASPLRLSETPPVLRAPPLLGQHTEEVLRELLGKSPQDIAALAAAGVL
jgi:formyl-CoA transferase